ncbi:MAG TPA: large conductance mechanosensitive channel protein MscL [Thermoanaerobaculia bacterium]|nr:large conductance mechanosensitive channel protein MscL [Thermoanaerobaculia bacterium]
MLGDFKAFLTRSNALALAIGVIIGAATTKLVTAVADDVLMPLIGLILPGGDWREAKLVLTADSAILYGHLLGAILDFTIIALVVYFIAKAAIRPAGGVPTKSCPECLELIPEPARRCRACGTVF